MFNRSDAAVGNAAGMIRGLPELPEIEHLRRTLEPWVVGARVLKVHLRRRDVVRIAGSRKARRGVKPRDLLQGDRILALARRGKSLALIGASGRVLVAHMGMTGSMRIVPCTSDQHSTRSTRPSNKHVHCEWVMERVSDVGKATTRQGGAGRCFRLVFRDPRRFGGLWPFQSLADLLEGDRGGWSRLGPDAFEPPPSAAALRERLLRTRQPIKAALLNQTLIAGVGNIYADEALFAARIHPKRAPATLSNAEWSRLARALHDVLERAVRAGGSSIRDYVDAAGEDGMFALEHRVYGRTGQSCLRCGETLRKTTIAQRTTVFCPRCQPRHR